jgi:hypothetical protein
MGKKGKREKEKREERGHLDMLFVIIFLVATSSIPGTIAITTIDQRRTCFTPSALGFSRRRAMELGSVSGTIPHTPADFNDRRSVLRKGTLSVSTLLAATGFAGGAVAKSPPPLSRDTMNFPRVHPGLTIGDASRGQICEIFVDFTCPYSRKLFQTVSSLSADAFTDRMAFVYHNVLQPWHHQSLWLHESSFAVKVLYPSAEVAYWTALFDDAPRWYDKEVYGLTRGEFYDKIAAFASDVVVAEAAKGGGDYLDATAVKGRILQYLIPPLQPGGNFPVEAKALFGSGPDDDENAIFPLTKQLVKFQRKRGVHVTPTCFFNGIEQGQISSGWTAKEWTDFLGQALR